MNASGSPSWRSAPNARTRITGRSATTIDAGIVASAKNGRATGSSSSPTPASSRLSRPCAVTCHDIRTSDSGASTFAVPSGPVRTSRPTSQSLNAFRSPPPPPPVVSPPSLPSLRSSAGVWCDRAVARRPSSSSAYSASIGSYVPASPVAYSFSSTAWTKTLAPVRYPSVGPGADLEVGDLARCVARSIGRDRHGEVPVGEPEALGGEGGGLLVAVAREPHATDRDTRDGYRRRRSSGRPVMPAPSRPADPAAGRRTGGSSRAASPCRPRAVRGWRRRSSRPAHRRAPGEPL